MELRVLILVLTVVTLLVCRRQRKADDRIEHLESLVDELEETVYAPEDLRARRAERESK